jgi:hypothetical protein
MDNVEKLAIQVSQNEEKQNKNSTPLCVTTMFFYNIVSINIYYAESDWFLGLLGDNTA